MLAESSTPGRVTQMLLDCERGPDWCNRAANAQFPAVDHRAKWPDATGERNSFRQDRRAVLSPKAAPLRSTPPPRQWRDIGFDPVPDKTPIGAMKAVLVTEPRRRAAGLIDFGSAAREGFPESAAAAGIPFRTQDSASHRPPSLFPQ